MDMRRGQNNRDSPKEFEIEIRGMRKHASHTKHSDQRTNKSPCPHEASARLAGTKSGHLRAHTAPEQCGAVILHRIASMNTRSHNWATEWDCLEQVEQHKTTHWPSNQKTIESSGSVGTKVLLASTTIECQRSSSCVSY